MNRQRSCSGTFVNQQSPLNAESFSLSASIHPRPSDGRGIKGEGKWESGDGRGEVSKIRRLLPRTPHPAERAQADPRVARSQRERQRLEALLPLRLERGEGWGEVSNAPLHNWVLANQRMAAALKAKGYAYRYVFAEAAGHTGPRRHCSRRAHQRVLGIPRLRRRYLLVACGSLRSTAVSEPLRPDSCGANVSHSLLPPFPPVQRRCRFMNPSLTTVVFSIFTIAVLPLSFRLQR